MKNRAIRYSALIFLVLWLGVIFYFSSQPADVSQETSDGVLEKLITVIYPDYNGLDEFAKQDIVITMVIPIRKLAHIFEFFILGGVSYLFLSTFKGALKNHRGIFSFLFGLICAVCDEFHQIFVPGRACQFTDVLVDSFGAFIAIMICVLIVRIRRRKLNGQ